MPAASGGAVSSRAAAPSRTSDLVYLQGERLMRWDHVTNYATILAENVAEFATSPGGGVIVLLQPQRVGGIILRSANGVQYFDLQLLNLSSMQMAPVRQHVTRLYHMSVSPDDNWLAYTLTAQGGQILLQRLPQTYRPAQAAVAGSTRPSSVDNNSAPALHSGDASSPTGAELPALLGECRMAGADANSESELCSDFAWAPDSVSILWHDARGIWLGSLQPAKVSLIHPASIQVSDPKGNQQEIQVRFKSPQWSPAGRYVLLTVLPSASAVRWQAVLDTRSGRLVQVSDSYKQDEFEACAAWLNSGDLVVAHADNAAAHEAPFMRQMRVMATNSEMLLPLKTVPLELDLFAPGAAADGLSRYYPLWPVQSQHGEIFFSLISSGPPATATMYQLNFALGTLLKMFRLPFEPLGLSWAPDDSGALIIGQRGQVIFVPVDGGDFLDLLPMLDAGTPLETQNFTWLPPMPRLAPQSAPRP
jgi:hypothetical protein